jgi:CheY-like chemotaxis protein
LAKCPAAIELSYEIHDCGSIEIDEEHLLQLVVNLFNNAMDSMPAGGRIELCCRRANRDELQDISDIVFGELAPQGQYVVLAVTDQGCGVDPSHRAQLLEPFATRKLDRQAGLGLSIVRSIVDRAGGALRWRTQIEQGSAIEVYLPTASTTQQATATIAPPAHILVAEDDLELRMLISRVLRKHGYQVFEASDGLAALELACTQRIDLLLTDVRMPQLDGMGLGVRFSEEHRGIPVLYMTGHGAASQSGPTVIPVLAKPFTAQRLLTAVAELLQRP